MLYCDRLNSYFPDFSMVTHNQRRCFNENETIFEEPVTDSHTEITPISPENVIETTTAKEFRDIEVITEISEEVLTTTPQYDTVQILSETEPTQPTPIVTTDQVTETSIDPEEETHESHHDNEITMSEVYDQREKDYNDEGTGSPDRFLAKTTNKNINKEIQYKAQ